MHVWPLLWISPQGCIAAFMGIFATQKAVSALQERMTELETTVRKLESANKHLELEWEELYDKVRRQMSRMSKRFAVDQKENGAEIVPEGESEAYPGVDPISKSIMLRRAGQAVKR